MLSNDEFLHFLGILLSMEVVEMDGPRRLYWCNGDGIFPGMKYRDIISYSQFEDIMKNLQLLRSDDPNQQLLHFLEATNSQFRKSVVSGSYLTLDESMIKDFHKDWKGKIKIIRKPRPIGHEIKNLCDAMSQIVLNLELYEGKDIMSGKNHVKEYGATTATTLRLT